jgi:hypothetical protein
LSVPSTLEAALKDAEVGAHYVSAENAIAIEFPDAALAPLDGWISYSRSRSDTVTPLASTIIQVESGAGPWCGELFSEESGDEEFSALVRLADNEPRSIAIAVQAVLEWGSENLPEAESQNKENPVASLTVTPLHNELRGMSAEIDYASLAAQVRAELTVAGYTNAAAELDPAKALYLAEVVECSKRVQAADEELSAFYPFSDMSDVGLGEFPSEEQLALRNELAGDVLRCLTIKNRLSEESYDVLAASIERLVE